MTNRAASGRRRRGIAGVLLLALAAGAARADESFAAAVPADVGLFIELRQADDLLIPLTESQAWLTVADLAGQPASVRETDEWRRRIEQTVGMSPVDAIRTLLARRVAFVAGGLPVAGDAAVLCRPADDPRALVRRWQARPLPTAGRISVYRLPGNISVAVHEDMLVFGDVVASGPFARVLSALEGGATATLAADAVYARLLARVPPDPVGVFFARLGGAAHASAPAAPGPGTAPATAPGPGTAPAGRPQLPALLRGSANVLLALHREDHLLQFTAVGDAPGDAPARDGSLEELVATLPERTLLAWAGHADYAALARGIGRLPERHILRVAYQLQEKSGSLERLTGALRTAACVAVGVTAPGRRAVPAPPVPAVAVLVAAREPERVAREWRTLLHGTVALYKLLSLKLGGPPPLLPASAQEVAGCVVEQFDFAAFVGPVAQQAFLGELHLSWTLDGDVLIIATHTDWLRQILAARRGAAPRLAGALELTRRPAAERRETIVVAQVGPIADLGRLWLDFLEQALPQVLGEEWWRNFQPGGDRVRLGVQVVEDRERKRLRIVSVTGGLPADGILRPGDEILGCNGRRFTTAEPVAEMSRGLSARPHARWIDLIVERDRVVREYRVRLPFVDPVQILQRIVGVGQIVQRIVYHEDLPDAEGPRGHLAVELRAGRPPLFAFGFVPASRPAADPEGP